MITMLIVLAFIVANIAMVISNKSSFKILFSFLTSLIVFIFLNNIKYEYSDLYITFVIFMNFIFLGYVKFSQTGRVRVLPSSRNRMTNNLIPIVSTLISTLVVVILLNNVSDEILERDILSMKESAFNYFQDFNIMFVTGVTITILFFYIVKRVKE